MDESVLIEGFVARGLSPKTIAVYLVAIRRAERDLDLATVSAVELARWADASLSGSRSMRSLFRSALKAHWQATERPDPPYRAIRVPRKQRMRCRALPEASAAALAAEARRRAAGGTRKGLAVLLALYGGLRRSEIAGLRWADISADGWLRVVGKGAERQIPLHPVLAAALAAARPASGIPIPRPRARRHEGRGPLFVGLDGGALHPTTVWTWVRELSTAAGIGPVQTHVLRHTALATALDATHDLRAVQEFAGHARPETTAGYTRVRVDRLRSVVAALAY